VEEENVRRLPIQKARRRNAYYGNHRRGARTRFLSKNVRKRRDSRIVKAPWGRREDQSNLSGAIRQGGCQGGKGNKGEGGDQVGTGDSARGALFELRSPNRQR